MSGYRFRLTGIKLIARSGVRFAYPKLKATRWVSSQAFTPVPKAVGFARLGLSQGEHHFLAPPVHI